jgi:hypothetical protein
MLRTLRKVKIRAQTRGIVLIFAPPARHVQTNFSEEIE